MVVSCKCRIFAVFYHVSIMADKKFYISKVTRDADTGVYSLSETVSLEDDFGYCRYKSLSGMNNRGAQKGVYSESYPESNAQRVYIEDSATREQTSCTLTVYFFGCDPQLPTEKTVEEQIVEAENGYHKFIDYIEGGMFLWNDDYRKRKALFYLTDAVEPSSDIIKDCPYLCVSVSLENVFGKTFAEDDTTIEDWLANGGKGE